MSKKTNVFVLKTKETDEKTIKQAFNQYLKERRKLYQYEQPRIVGQLILLSKESAHKGMKYEYIAPDNPPFVYFYFSLKPSLRLYFHKFSECWGDFQLGEVLPPDEFRYEKEGTVNGSCFNNGDSNKGNHAEKKDPDCREEEPEEEDTEEEDDEEEDDEDEDEEKMRTRDQRSSTRLKKWAFKYNAERSADDVWKDLRKALKDQEKITEIRDAVQGAIINTKNKHVYIEFTTFIDRSFLQKVPSIVKTSIDKWEAPKLNIMTLFDQFMKANGYETWPISQRREEPIPAAANVEEQARKDLHSRLFSSLNDESSFEILFSLSTGKTIKNILEDCYDHSQLTVLQSLCGGLKYYFKDYQKYTQSNLPK